MPNRSAASHSYSSGMKPYYDSDGITIYHGDCLTVLSEIRDVDLVITSPPYNLDASSSFRHTQSKPLWGHRPLIADGYGTHDDAMPWPEYEDWQRVVLTACWESLSDEGAIFYNHKPRFRDGEMWLPLSLNPGLPLRQIVIWDRGNGMNFAPTYYLPIHEWIVIFAKEAFRLTARGAGEMGDVWRFPPESGSQHPAPFPVGLPARIIETTAPSLVLDPFMGSGTTLRAAKNAGVQAVGIDIEERYCEMAVQRLAQGVLAFE